MNLTDTDIAGHVVATVNKFREAFTGADDGEELFVAQATLVSDVAARMAVDETPLKAAMMIAGQLHILFEDNPGLQQLFMVEQLRRLQEKKR